MGTQALDLTTLASDQVDENPGPRRRWRLEAPFKGDLCRKAERAVGLRLDTLALVSKWERLFGLDLLARDLELDERLALLAEILSAPRGAQ
jgi:hypothetical protein